MVLRNKFKEFDIDCSKIIHVTSAGSTVKAGKHFSVEFVYITHSLPEPNVLAIKTPFGTIVHTGDWKIDPDPLVGEATDSNRIKELGNEGVLALVCDSTNVFNEGHSGSEKDVFENLEKIIKKCQKKVVVSCFASNIARLATVAKVAKLCGRKVVSIGRSMKNMENVARSCGYLKEISKFYDAKSLPDFKDNEVLILCTGSQGGR